MAKISCFSALIGGKRKKSKDMNEVSYAKNANGDDCPKVKPVEFMGRADTADIVKGSDNTPACGTKVVADTVAELAYEGRDENGDKSSEKRCLSDVDLVAGAGSSGYNSDGADKDANKFGVGCMVPAASSRLERSCSNIETARSGSKAFDLLPAKSRSYDDLMSLPAGSLTTPNGAPDASPTASVKTSCTADRVMLKKRSSSQILPSRSRKLWWRLFLWSHRNLHRTGAGIPTLPSADTDDMPQQHDGYTSDTLDTGTAVPDAKKKEIAVEEEPIPNQWVAFSAEASSLDRVSAWVNSLGDGSFHIEEEHITEHDDGAVRPHCPGITESSSGAKGHAQSRWRTADEAIQANNIIQTLNTFSSVAHIAGMGLKVVPVIAAFSSLRAVNLSANFIDHFSPGSLPKGLHSLDLSRNKIATIEGLRELTRLRVLNLSYNRISRIGHGLSNCTAIRELYLAGNKISEVEGLHRLLKLAVLDLSFNKITTTKALGQLVANYSSLRALNLLGNPVQTNIGDDTLRKAVSGLLPRLEYLNKQPVKPQRAREVAKDSVAKAALGNSGWSSRRRVSRRLSQSPGLSVRIRGREGSSSHRGSRSRTKVRPQSSSLTRR